MTSIHTPATLVASSNTAITQDETHQVIPSITLTPPGSVLTQVGTVLALVVLFILCAAWLMRKLGFTGGMKNSKLLHVVGNCQLGHRERVLIVEVADTWLVLGVTAHQVTLLHVLPVQADPNGKITQMTKSIDFNQLLQKIIKNPEKSA